MSPIGDSALVGGAVLMTACRDSDKAADTGATQGSSSAAASWHTSVTDAVPFG
ncbi:hypothetical protein AB0E85_13750 [Streptomyces sp. NPDC029044]|uniref:hypothetical protein n=1 Tax=Streptomyces sp. NPDC029044 TaxID=3157198 RepID=UPI0033CD8FB3